MKKWSLRILPFFALLFLMWKSSHRETFDDWQTYQKRDNGILSYQTTDEEKETIKIPPTTRKPASQKREVVGRKIDRQHIKYENHIDKRWRDKLADHLMKFQKTNTKVLIKKEKSLIKMKRYKGQLLEQVIITYLLPNGDQNSFRAFVDSASGKIVQTWDRTIHDKVKKSPGFKPTGTL